MGVTIHYRGRLKSPDHIEQLITEVESLAEEAGWQYRVISPMPDLIFDHIYVTLMGIVVDVHPDCESLSLVFDEQGRLISLPGLDIIAYEGFLVEKEDELGTYVTLEMPPLEDLGKLTWDDLAAMDEINTAYTKTQFSGAETHILLCKLLRYLEKKYFAEFKVFDEGDYYYTGNASALAEKIAFLNHIIENAAKAPIVNPHLEDSTLEERLSDFINYLEILARNAPVKPSSDKNVRKNDEDDDNKLN